MEQMEQRYAALAAEHTQVSGRRTTCAKRASAIDAIAREWGVRRKDARAIKIARLSPRFFPARPKNKTKCAASSLLLLLRIKKINIKI